METYGSKDFTKQGQDLKEGAAATAQNGIRGAQKIGSRISDSVSDAAGDLKSAARPKIAAAADSAQKVAGQGMDAARDASDKIGDTLAQTTKSITSYTRANPIQALVIAGVTGAFLVALSKLLGRSRY
jgi:ElaB/YqjD/DUF883 family membrane-anchored ribosome-binding protein